MSYFYEYLFFSIVDNNFIKQNKYIKITRQNGASGISFERQFLDLKLLSFFLLFDVCLGYYISVIKNLRGWDILQDICNGKIENRFFRKNLFQTLLMTNAYMYLLRVLYKTPTLRIQFGCEASPYRRYSENNWNRSPYLLRKENFIPISNGSIIIPLDKLTIDISCIDGIKSIDYIRSTKITDTDCKIYNN